MDDSAPAVFLNGGATGNPNAALLASIAGNTLAKTSKKANASLLPPLIDQVNPSAAHAINLIWASGLDGSTVQRIQVAALKNVAQAWKQQNEESSASAPKTEPSPEPAAFDVEELRKRLARQAEGEASRPTQSGTSPVTSMGSSIGPSQPRTSPATSADLSTLLGLSSTSPSAFGAVSVEGTAFAAAPRAVRAGPKKRVKTGLKVGGFVYREITDAEVARVEALVGHVTPASSSTSKPPDSILDDLLSVNEILATGKDDQPNSSVNAASSYREPAKPKLPACAAGVAAKVAAAAAAAAAKAAAVAKLAPVPAPTKLPPSLRAPDPWRQSKPARGGDVLEDYRPEDWRMPQERRSVSPQRVEDQVHHSGLGRDDGMFFLSGGDGKGDDPPLRRPSRRAEDDRIDRRDEHRDDTERPPLDPFLNALEKEKAVRARQLEFGKAGAGARDRPVGRYDRGGYHDDLVLPGPDDRNAKRKGDKLATASSSASRRFSDRSDRSGMASTRDSDRRSDRNRNSDRGAESRAGVQRKRDARPKSSSSSSSDSAPSAKKPVRKSIFSTEPGESNAAPASDVARSRKIIFVSSKAAQLIIGKNGDTVHEIQRQAGCGIQIRREASGAPLCEISLSGNHLAAEELMEKVLHQHGLTLKGPVEPCYG